MPPFPPTLHPTDQMLLGDAPIPLCRPVFAHYTGSKTVHTFGGKDLLDVDGRPQFAEVAILRLFEADGWQGRWVETYGHMHAPALWREWKPGGPGAQAHIPIEEAWVKDKLQAIAQANGGTYSGCWDVLAWKGDRLVFAESKKQRKDRIRDTQVRWLDAALQRGLRPEDFLLVEWALG
ncbi:MAG: hypothetical protein H6594_06415 [Flavobacteriales bacterium]|nr:hypothetical protein [Flavobacteriales bacterium]